ncbi:MAG TPA: hypothetical protein VIL07_10435 [Symbiobacteriaceae bacterium]
MAAPFLLAGAVAAVIGAVKQQWEWFVTAAVACLPLTYYFLGSPSWLFNLQGLLLLGLPLLGVVAVRFGKAWLAKLVGGILAVCCTAWLIVVIVDPW